MVYRKQKQWPDTFPATISCWVKHIHYIFRSFVIRNARFPTVCETKELSLNHRRVKSIQRPLSTEIRIYTICLVTSTCTEMYHRPLEDQSLFSCCSNIACRRIFSIRCNVRPSSSHTKTPKIFRNRAKGSFHTTIVTQLFQALRTLPVTLL